MRENSSLKDGLQQKANFVVNLRDNGLHSMPDPVFVLAKIWLLWKLWLLWLSLWSDTSSDWCLDKTSRIKSPWHCQWRKVWRSMWSIDKRMICRNLLNHIKYLFYPLSKNLNVHCVWHSWGRRYSAWDMTISCNDCFFIVFFFKVDTFGNGLHTPMRM